MIRDLTALAIHPNSVWSNENECSSEVGSIDMGDPATSKYEHSDTPVPHSLPQEGGNVLDELPDTNLDKSVVEQISNELSHDNENEHLINNKPVKTVKTRITDYFKGVTGLEENTEMNGSQWVKTIADSSRKRFECMNKNMNEKLLEGMRAGRLWSKEREMLRVNATNEANGNTRLLQEQNSKPIFFGSDVVALYPSLEPTGVARIAGDAVRKSSVQLRGINYYFLVVYLFLVLGVGELEKLGLSECIPRRKKQSHSSVKSLAAEINRDLDCWDFGHIDLNEKLKRELVATMIQLMVLLLTSTTCYKFGGRLYKQVSGLGIGLRASAAIARVAMCTWDVLWAHLQAKWGLSIQIIFRYVDDIRMYMQPIRRGWKWIQGTWKWTDEEDNRSPESRTIEEVGKSLNSVWDFLSFTTEGERDFQSNKLPTLDFATSVNEDGYVSYEFFSKPMSSNLVLERGTALSKSCVFSSLRQDLVRRLYNTDLEADMNKRKNIVEDFIQKMVNSGHKYQYIKAVVLQGISKFKYMVQRSKLEPTSKKFAPIHRDRYYRWDERTLLKYTNKDTWYTGIPLKDKFRNGWKSWIKRKGERRAENKRSRRSGKHRNQNKTSENKPVTTAIFVPPTKGGGINADGTGEGRPN